MLVATISLIIALVAVVKAADWFLGAAEKIGVSLRLPPFILGVVLGGFGTSLPELATSVAAVLDGTNSVTIANIAGSNIANILVILGISTIVLGTIRFEKNVIDLDLPLLFSITILFALLVVDGGLSRLDGAILLFGFVGYMVYSLAYKEDKEYHKGLIKLIGALTKESKRQVERGKGITRLTIPIAIASIILLALASKIAVDSLLDIVTELDIAVEVLTFFALAIGTSLPELTVSLKALRKGQGDVVIGNIIGSSMFNILLIGGVAAVLRPQTVEAGLIPWILGGMIVAVMLLVIGSITRRIHLWEGFTYILLYVALASKIIEV